MFLETLIHYLVQQIWGLPSLLFIFGVAAYITFQLNFVQFRYLSDAISIIFLPQKESNKVAKSGELSQFQAFINTLGANVGNGSLAGIAVAIYAGGPGAIVWLLVLATFSAALRYSEVFLSTYLIDKVKVGFANGGPMSYMSFLPGGIVWSYLFATLALGYMFVGGNLAQCHAVGMAVHRVLGINDIIVGFFVLGFIAYIFLGGAQRIVAVLDKMVPLKVWLFLVTAVIMLLYHYQNIPHALYLMGYSAYAPRALFGGSVAFALQQTVAVGFQQGVFASEAGLGTAAIAFGSTKGQNPVQSGILAMLGVFINIHVICFLVALCLIASGVWDNGETSAAMIISAYETVFGRFGGWIVMALIINFAMSVLVASAYNGKLCWNFLFSGKYSYVFPIIFSVAAFCGTWMHVELVWQLNNLVNGVLLMINVLGLLWSVNIMKKELNLYSLKHN